MSALIYAERISNMPKKHDSRIKAEAQALALSRNPVLSAADIRLRLELNERFADKQRLPKPRTIAAWAREVRAGDTSGPWRLGDADQDPEDARVILDTIHEVIARTDGEVKGLTVAEADWVARLRRATDLPAWEVYVYARRYIAAGGSSEALDLEVATYGDEEALYAATRTRRLQARSSGRSGSHGQLTIRKGDKNAK